MECRRRNLCLSTNKTQPLDNDAARNVLRGDLIEAATDDVVRACEQRPFHDIEDELGKLILWHSHRVGLTIVAGSATLLQPQSTDAQEQLMTEASATEPEYLNDFEVAASCGMIVAYHANKNPDRVAIVAEQGGNRTYGELNERINQVAHYLRSSGLQPGDAVSLVCTNRPEFAEAILGCFRVGLRVSPVNWHLTAPEMTYIVNDSESKVLFGDARLGTELAAVIKDSPNVSIALAIGGDIEGFESFDEQIKDQSTKNISNPIRGFEMLYTSGTTGHPKGVYRPQVMSTSSVLDLAQFDPETDMSMATGPLYHAAPLGIDLMAAFGKGTGTYLVDRWDPETCLKTIQDNGITHTHMVPTMFHRMLALPPEIREQYDISSLKFVIHGAAPCPVHVKEAMLDWFGDIIFEYYGATEGVGTVVTPDQWRNKPGGVGQAPEGMIIVDEVTDEEVPVGEIGIIWIPAPAEGGFKYFKADEKTEKAYRNGTHYSMHDMGWVDEDGWLFLSDRRADLILSGGVNVYPAEVDAALLKHPSVADACTIGIPNTDWGQEVMAVVELKEGIAESEKVKEEILSFCRENLAKFKCPRSLNFMDSLPRSEAGKIQRRKVRDIYAPSS